MTPGSSPENVPNGWRYSLRRASGFVRSERPAPAHSLNSSRPPSVSSTHDRSLEKRTGPGSNDSPPTHTAPPPSLGGAFTPPPRVQATRSPPAESPTPVVHRHDVWREW